MSRPKPHFWRPVNKSKYIGDVNNIVSRSSWETKFMIFCDMNVNVIQWNSEDIKIPYKSPVDNKYHTYHVDFLMVVKTKDESLKTYLVEVKPYNQTKPPRNSKNKRVLMEALCTYEVNQAKWQAATKFAQSKGWEFKIVTEYDLGLK